MLGFPIGVVLVGSGVAVGVGRLARSSEYRFRRGGRGVVSLRIGASEIRKTGVSRFDLGDPYYLALSLSWLEFALCLLGVYLGINLLFAVLYAAVPGCVENAGAHSLLDAFFFSIETLATVGYGRMVPVTLYGHVVASAEIFVGIGFTAVLTGLVFVRFSKPKSRIVYADNPVVTDYAGVPSLMLRIGNARPSVLHRVRVQMYALVHELTPEGHALRRNVDLRLLRSDFAVFPITLTLVHPLDEASPLAGMTAETLEQGEVRLFVLVSALDSTVTAEIADVRSYEAADILFGMRYANAVTSREGGVTVADMRLISALEPG